jgi:methylenetetrahydrofolate dehydrogenase (NADP+)/methenyltetrahydrofolate cyclohydrolase
MPLILDGRQCAHDWKHELRQEIEAAGVAGQPCLAVLLVGQHPASQSYVRHKQKACEEVGIRSVVVPMEASASEQELLEAVGRMNRDASIHGILVQLPLPAQVNTDRLLAAVDPKKDVDGFHPYNLGCLTAGQPTFIPCTPLGIDRLLQHYQITLEGKEVVIVGRSRIVGKPLALLWSLKRPGGSPTITLAHSGTKDLVAVCRRADLLVVAAGRHHLIGAEHLRPGVVVIDVGIHTVDVDGQHRLSGDVDTQAAMDRCAAITPVPGGVGPMTVAALLHNTWQSFCQNS